MKTDYQSFITIVNDPFWSNFSYFVADHCKISKQYLLYEIAWS